VRPLASSRTKLESLSVNTRTRCRHDATSLILLGLSDEMLGDSARARAARAIWRLLSRGAGPMTRADRWREGGWLQGQDAVCADGLMSRTTFESGPRPEMR